MRQRGERSRMLDRQARARKRRMERVTRRLGRVLRRRRRWGEVRDPWNRFRAGLALLITVIVGGTVGYIVLGVGPVSALYQTIITISTVGYSESRVIDPDTLRYQIFTLVLILVGTSSALYTLGVLMETLFEGHLDDRLRRRHMRESINQLNGHTIICGYGEVGRAITADLVKQNCDVVVIDHDESVADDDHLTIIADATHDHVLVEAGIERARALVLAFNSDVSNLYVALSARAMCPELFIVARTNSLSTTAKLESAGADRVINPNEIGAARMAAVTLHPEVITYFDELMPSTATNDILVKEHRIAPESAIVKKQLGDSAIGGRWDGLVLAVGRDGEWVSSPANNFELSAGDVLVLLGTYEQLAVVIDEIDG